MTLNKNLGIVDILDSNNNPILQLQAIQNEENFGYDVYYKHRYFGLSLDIRNAIGKPGRSKWYVRIFYWLPIILGMITIYAIICMFNPDLGWCIKLHV